MASLFTLTNPDQSFVSFHNALICEVSAGIELQRRQHMAGVRVTAIVLEVNNALVDSVSYTLEQLNGAQVLASDNQFAYAYVILFQPARFTKPSRAEEWGYVSLYWLHHALNMEWRGMLKRSHCAAELPSHPIHRSFRLYDVPRSLEVAFTRLSPSLVEQALEYRMVAFACSGNYRVLPAHCYEFVHLQTKRDVVLDLIGFFLGLFVVTRRIIFGVDIDDHMHLYTQWKQGEIELFHHRMRTCVTHRLHYNPRDVQEITLGQLNDKKWTQYFGGTASTPMLLARDFPLAGKAVAQKSVALRSGMAIFPADMKLEPMLCMFHGLLKQCIRVWSTRLRHIMITKAIPYYDSLMQFARQFKPGQMASMMMPVQASLSSSIDHLKQHSPACVQLMLHRIHSGSPKVHLRYEQRNMAFGILLNVGVPVQDIEDLVQHGIPRIYHGPQQQQRAKQRKIAQQMKYLHRRGATYKHRCDQLIRQGLCPYGSTEPCLRQLSLRIEQNVGQLYTPAYYIYRVVNKDNKTKSS